MLVTLKFIALFTASLFAGAATRGKDGAQCCRGGGVLMCGARVICLA
jgi:hypothetical protein